MLSCKKAFNPIATNGNLSYLVVEGIINSSGIDSTFIRLSRTVNINSATSSKAELHASIKVESNNNVVYSLTELSTGNYALPPVSLSDAQKYRLHIKTSDGREYLSDYTEVKVSPQIDKVGYTIGSDSVSLYVNTHDAKNATHYYRWEYDETWQFIAGYHSMFAVKGRALVARDTDTFNCWGRAGSGDVLLASTARLSRDEVYQAPLKVIYSANDRISIRYSILVKQYALSNEAYTYWLNLKKNTESLGTIFDAQPSEGLGNLYCVSNPAEPVIGYVSAGTISTSRIYINKTDLPPLWITANTCQLQRFPSTDIGIFFGGAAQWAPITTETDDKGNVFFIATTPSCIDCRLKNNGTLKKPGFWQ